MWIKRENILEYFKANYGNGFEIDNIKESCKSLRVYLQPKAIEKWLEEKAEESGVNIVLAKKEYQFKTVKEIETVIDELFKFDAEKKKLEKFSFSMIDYILNVETLKIYSKKCLQLCLLLEKLAGKSHLGNKVYEFFDFTIKDDKVLISDVDRVCVPIMKVYGYALSTYCMANNPSSYLNKIIQPGVEYDSMLPSNKLLMDSYLNPDEFVALTNKQKLEKFQKGL